MAPKRVDREEKQQAIVGAAVEVFARRGFTAATIEEIARTAGLGKGTVYQYFHSKDDPSSPCSGPLAASCSNRPAASRRAPRRRPPRA